VHNGHVDIASRAARLFDRLVVAIYDTPSKRLLFSTDERVDMMRQALKSLPNVQVASYHGLTVDFARQVGAKVIVRGLRVISDFELEYQMSLTNRKLAPEIDTVCWMTSLEYAFVSSTIVKELAALGGCIEQFVPAHVVRALADRFRGREEAGGPPVQLMHD
jgi:pantetheine-phosphate adenylyltransferase